MSFRLEEKIFVKNLNVFEFKKWLIRKGAKTLYPERQINSLYFENNLKMYNDSIEGVVPRKKIRIRTYNTKNFLKGINFTKEVKISYYNYRDKKVDKYLQNFQNLNIKISDNAYGVCRPFLNVVYMRNYFELMKTRITLDKDINYYSIRNGKISDFGISDKEFIIEVKSSNIDEIDFLKELLPIQRTRFSKYCRGIKLLNLA